VEFRLTPHRRDFAVPIFQNNNEQGMLGGSPRELSELDSPDLPKGIRLTRVLLGEVPRRGFRARSFAEAERIELPRSA
jgi:hypothetical protein